MNTDTVRTNIELNRQLIETGLQVTGLKTRRELVDYALRELLRHRQQQKLLSLKGNIDWQGNLDEMRHGHEH